MMDLCKIDAAKKMRRFYRLSVEPTLFGEFALVREWGRIGATGGRIKEDWHASALDADAAFDKALILRRKRGYQKSTAAT